MDVNQMNARIIAEFRANDGVVGGPFEGMPLLLLHTVGAKSGITRVNPMTYRKDGNRYIVFASKAGAPTNPAWYHNLKVNPDVTVEVGTSKFNARATELTGDERDRIWEAQKAQVPVFADYEEKADRTIPLVALTPVG